MFLLFTAISVRRHLLFTDKSPEQTKSIILHVQVGTYGTGATVSFREILVEGPEGTLGCQ